GSRTAARPAPCGYGREAAADAGTGGPLRPRSASPRLPPGARGPDVVVGRRPRAHGRGPQTVPGGAELVPRRPRRLRDGVPEPVVGSGARHPGTAAHRAG